MIESIVLTVTGMKCGGCEANVTTKLTALNGVVAVAASSKNQHVSIEFDADSVSLDSVKQVITAAGFTVVDDDV